MAGVLAFARHEYDARLATVRRAMGERQLDGLIISAPESIYYLTGYQTKGVFAHQYLVVPGSGVGLLLMTRRIERGNVQLVADQGMLADWAFYEDTGESAGVLLDLLQRHGLQGGRLGIEKRSWYLLVQHYERLQDALPLVALDDASDLVERVRLTKSPTELEYLREAGRIAVAGMRAGMEAVRPGASDSTVAAGVLRGLLEAGGEWIATWPNVTCGVRTGLAHATWEGMAVAPGDAVGIELAGVVKRYHTPLFRSVVLGPGTPEQRELAAVVRESTREGLARIRAGVNVGDVYQGARAAIDRSRYRDLPAFRLGYSVGIGFPPTWAQELGINIVQGSSTRLESGMVFHMITLIKKPGHFGLGDSASVAVTDDGYENLTGDMAAGPLFLG